MDLAAAPEHLDSVDFPVRPGLRGSLDLPAKDSPDSAAQVSAGLPDSAAVPVLELAITAASHGMARMPAPISM